MIRLVCELQNWLLAIFKTENFRPIFGYGVQNKKFQKLLDLPTLTLKHLPMFYTRIPLVGVRLQKSLPESKPKIII